jgi:hypothetical protein
MSTAAEPSGLVIGLIAAGIFVAAIVGFAVVARLPLERRVRFARFLGHAFLAILVLALVLGMAAQAFR